MFRLEKPLNVQSLVRCYKNMKDKSESNVDDMVDAWLVKFQKETKYLLEPFDTLN